MKTFQITIDTWAKKKPIQSNELKVNQKIKYFSGKIIPYISLEQAGDTHILVTMDYSMGKWYFYEPHTDITQDPDAQYILNKNKIWTKEELIINLRKKAIEFNLLLKPQHAYMLATIQRETAGTFQPVREAFWLSEEWRRNNLRYYKWYGRGYVQLTWESNYRKYSKILNENLVENPDRVMDPEISLFILVHGFKYGVFTGYAIEDFINPNVKDYYNARKCINGLDAADIIADCAEEWEVKL